MSRVLEVVLCMSLEGWPAASASRARSAQRDFGAELGRAWRICPQVRMKRGHERVTIEPCEAVEAEPSPGESWWTWVESTAHERRVVAARTHTLAPGVTLREVFDAEHAGIVVAAPAPAGPPDSNPSSDAGEAEAADVAVAVERERPVPADVASPPEAARVRLVSERRRGRWADDSGVVVEMTLDDVTIHGVDPSPRRYCELRLVAPDWQTPDARAAALRALFAAARELSGAWPAFVQLTSVIDRACAGALAETASVKAQFVDLSGVRTQRAALFALSGDIAAQWLGNEGGVLDHEDPEFVHQMRVALRRLRTLMRFFPRYANGGWKEAFETDLRWLAALLGTVRDWDVFSTETLPALIAADGDSAEWAGTLDAARAQCVAARVELRQGLHSARYARLTLGWLEWLCTFVLPPAAADDDAPSLKQHVTKRVRRQFGHLYGAPSLATLDAAARHQVRIDAKRLRYALEFFASLASRRTRTETIKTLARVQGVLGEANDTVVALHRLEQLAAPPYQTGFVRGYGAALERRAVHDAEALLASLRPPKLGGKAVSGRGR
ncbi:CHAD domain-containing protein [Burkholderia ubonensis]|uniref:CHAD domain-containing protein n=1 Tax=Burkholderia ubonensis subsp. mesacidophila TaxID=265293 RepID=A0A2A4FJL6_9BURK|nr:CHAD domain-containing protein [Burkholderia ubonensis]PCE33913.1 CHAD domain-containing protein [Burkholderia ubonensis subsp. mesacidophila]